MTTLAPHPQPHTDLRQRNRADRERRTDDVIARLAALDRLGNGADPERRGQLIDELIEANLPVARSIAARYRNRGISDDDLEQVACLALVRVARTYDHTSGHDFMSYAVPSIRGEVRRHFRDHGWMVRPPRRLQELQLRIAGVESELSTRLGRPPTAADLARLLEVPVTEVEEALAARGCFAPTSLDQLTGPDSTSVLDRFAHHEPGLAAAEARVVLAPVLPALTERERLILHLRFAADFTQQQIADEVGVSQMQVSRLLSALLSRLRDAIGEPQRLVG